MKIVSLESEILFNSVSWVIEKLLRNSVNVTLTKSDLICMCWAFFGTDNKK